MTDEATIEQEGLKWQTRSDEYLVGYVSDTSRPERFHSPAIVEMQRRQTKAVRELVMLRTVCKSS